ncbi:MAG: hypothetical protein D6686_09165 [Alphaproteobacteria bacterium]|nr:MAG: hypothetical protein D6686_09165 [Alphaproteobacteria bacterium]
MTAAGPAAPGGAIARPAAPGIRLRAPSVQLPRGSGGRTLPQMLRDNARSFGPRPALRSKRGGLWRTLDWAALWAATRRAAAGLSALGLGRGEVLMILSENREEAWIAQLAAGCLGAVAVAVYPDAGAEEVAHVIAHAGVAMALAEDQEQVDKILARPDAAARLRRILHVDPRGLWDYRAAGLTGWDEMLAAGRDGPWLDEAIAAAGPEDVAVYCYTSGTTGRPKAAMLSHAFVLDNAYRLMGALGIRAGGNYLSYISPAWAAEQFFGVGLVLLAPLVVHVAEKPETVQKDLREIGPEFLMFTPRQWEMLASNVEARMMDAPAWRQRLFA